MSTLVEEAIPDADQGGSIEEAEMYARFAAEIATRLYTDPEDCDVAAVEALLDRSRRIMNRLINEELARKKKPDA